MSSPLLNPLSVEGLYVNGLPTLTFGKILFGLEANSVKDGRLLLKGCIGPALTYS
jgi:hypothetical protein